MSEPYDEMEQRIRHARQMRRRCLKRALMWRGLIRTSGHGHMLVEVCRREQSVEFANVRYWIIAERMARGR